MNITIITTARTFDVSIPDADMPAFVEILNSCLEKKTSCVFVTAGPSKIPAFAVSSNYFVGYIVEPPRQAHA